MMPLSWRIEKFIYALWHAAVVGIWLFWMGPVEHYKLDKWLTGTFGDLAGEMIRHGLTLYVVWQIVIFFLHINNALTGKFHIYFNQGSFGNFIRNQAMMLQQGSGRNLGPTSYYNINRVIAFRESKMGAVSQSEAAEILVKTSMLDAISSGAYQGHNSKRAASNLNSRLGAMGQSDGLKFLMNQKD